MRIEISSENTISQCHVRIVNATIVNSVRIFNIFRKNVVVFIERAQIQWAVLVFKMFKTLYKVVSPFVEPNIESDILVLIIFGNQVRLTCYFIIIKSVAPWIPLRVKIWIVSKQWERLLDKVEGIIQTLACHFIVVLLPHIIFFLIIKESQEFRSYEKVPLYFYLFLCLTSCQEPIIKACRPPIESLVVSSCACITMNRILLSRSFNFGRYKDIFRSFAR